jgi:hypothetical protein
MRVRVTITCSKIWLGGLDSNQDNQIQNLMYCQLYDLPAAGRRQQKRAVRTTPLYFSGGSPFRQPRPKACSQSSAAFPPEKLLTLLRPSESSAIPQRKLSGPHPG